MWGIRAIKKNKKKGKISLIGTQIDCLFNRLKINDKTMEIEVIRKKLSLNKMLIVEIMAEICKLFSSTPAYPVPRVPR